MERLLTAKMKNGEIISLGETYDRAFLLELRKREQFYCRHCSNRVHLKLGTKRIFHFAHEKGNSCVNDYDRESQYHLNGKFQLYQWLKSLGVNPQLEPYFSKIKQRSDLAFQYEGKTYVLEFQCSPISEEIFVKRTKGYRRLLFHPIWILGGKNIHRLAAKKVSLSNFHTYFIRKNNQRQFYLPSFCPELNQFIFLHPIHFFSPKNALTTFTFFQQNNMHINHLLDPKIFDHFPFYLWRKELNKYKFSTVTRKDAYKSMFLQELYSRRLNILLLPPYVGIPLKWNLAFYESPMVWQTYIFLDHIFENRKGHVISFHDVFLSVLRRIKKKELTVRSLPNIKERLLPFAIKEYLTSLATFHVLYRHDEHTFSIQDPVKMGETIEQCLKEEEHFYEKYKIYMLK